MPTQLTRGGSSDIVSAAHVHEMCMLIPHAEALEVAAAGHMIAGDDNGVFMARLSDVLVRLK
ncbi:hypothetical protein J7I84_01495 [Arthrobacter sp. ISL-85]|uniref:alpha/beta fold hydrolase n=1 Tax=Arthrobacter sp. ISL-85 TaxID=2819115 RepID=UPI001BE66C3B|nr:hypothetical protein [Arthrobacter sp. ISL-85]MBT2565182.1 hypothetical protein [Arthrobacter sp. ISL-85]